MTHPTTQLTGKTITLELLNHQHQVALALAADDKRIWTYATENATPETCFERWYEKAIMQQQTNQSIVFIIKHHQTQQVIGSSRFYDTVEAHKRTKIGFTWYNPTYWGSAVNPECKFLMLQYAFETLGFNRVAFEVDQRNKRSLAAMKKLGATEEGILRKHIILGDGFIRDTVILSIIDDDWHQIKPMLLRRINTFLDT